MVPLNAITAEMGRMMELAQQGFHCSEILLFTGLEAQGKSNPDVIRAVSSLAGGIGFFGRHLWGIHRRRLSSRALCRQGRIGRRRGPQAPHYDLRVIGLVLDRARKAIRRDSLQRNHRG